MTNEDRQTVIDALELGAMWADALTADETDKIAAALAIMRREREPVAWKCAKCGNTSNCEGVTPGDNWCNSCAVCGEMKPLYR